MKLIDLKGEDLGSKSTHRQSEYKEILMDKRGIREDGGEGEGEGEGEEEAGRRRR